MLARGTKERGLDGPFLMTEKRKKRENAESQAYATTNEEKGELHKRRMNRKSQLRGPQANMIYSAKDSMKALIHRSRDDCEEGA